MVLHDKHVVLGKPDPEIYLNTAYALGYHPEDCVVFEDSISGVKAGKAAGCQVIGICTTHSAEELDMCDRVIRDFTEIGLADLQALVQASA